MLVRDQVLRQENISNPKQIGEPVISLHRIKKCYELTDSSEVVTALHDIHLAPDSEFYPVRKGEFVMLRGPSGGGKTTLLNIMGCIDAPTKGSLEIFDTKITAEAKDNFLADLRLRKIGFVFQTFNLLATMSAYENVELPMTILGKLSSKERRKRVETLLTQVGLRDRMEHLPSELSGGEQQRVTIARALANEPEVLLLDEPTGDLDTRNTVDIMNLLLDLNRNNGVTCIMVTHNPDVECYADRILYVQDGKFCRQVLNAEQVALDYDLYSNFLRHRDD